jgi:3-oxoacyl-[acyl-carrier-protein] synthase II
MGAGGLGAWDLDHGMEIATITVNSLGPFVGKELPYPRMWKAILDEVHPLSPLKALSNIPTAHLAIRFNARGVCQTITTACTSSAQAIGEAFRQIRWGLADVIVAGGSDSMINPNGLVAFSMLGVMSRNNREWQTAARPFDKRRDGFMLGEGAAVFVLEELEHCLARGCQPIAELIGYANTCDAFRLTDEPPEAWGSIAAMQQALEDGGIEPLEVDYINAHGTGTVMNDKTETHAIRSVFGERAGKLPISSTKSMIGHLVAAAGAVELAACVLAMLHQKIPPTINYLEPDPECDLDYVPNAARDAHINFVLSNSFGFGGQNACLLLRRYRGA